MHQQSIAFAVLQVKSFCGALNRHGPVRHRSDLPVETRALDVVHAQVGNQKGSVVYQVVYEERLHDSQSRHRKDFVSALQETPGDQQFFIRRRGD